jgi:hypothetical protein
LAVIYDFGQLFISYKDDTYGRNEKAADHKENELESDGPKFH